MKRFFTLSRIVCFILICPIFFLSCASHFPRSTSCQLVNIERDSSQAAVDARYYKKTGREMLQLHIFYPEGYDITREKPYPVALSFHGGAWTMGSIEWGYSDAQFFTSLGFVGIAVEYRLAGPGSNSVLDAMKDANSSVRWTRLYAKDINIDPEKILVVGHSAGGHLGISTAMFPDYKERSEDESISSVPNMIWAFAPAVSLARNDYFRDLLKGKERAKNCSPADNIGPCPVPMNIIHGSADELVPISDTRKFVADMGKKGNPVFLWEYPSGTHGFFYDDPAGIDFWQKIIEQTTKESGWLE